MDMTNTQHTETTTGITWNIDQCSEAGPGVRGLGWTHNLTVSRPKGRKLYTTSAVIENGEIVRFAPPVKLPF